MDNQQRKIDERLAWLGGFWDGEGTVTLTFRKPKKLYPTFTPLLSLVNTNEMMMDEVFDIFSTLHLPFYRQYGAGTEKWKARHSIIIAGMKRCQNVLPILTPYLFGKRIKAEKLSAFIESRLSQPKSRNRLDPLTPAEWQLAIEIRDGKFIKSLTDYMPRTAIEAVKV